MLPPYSRWIDRPDHDQHRAGQRVDRGGDAEGQLLDAHRIGAHQPQRALVLADRLDRAADERARKIQGQGHGQHDRHGERRQHPVGNAVVAQLQAAADVARLDAALVHAETQDQPDLDDEREPEEECQPAHPGVGAAPLEGLVVEAVDQHAQHEEGRHQQHTGQDRIDAGACQQIGAVGAQHQQGGMRHVGNVEQPEGHRQPQADRGIEASEQHPEEHRLEQEVEREHHEQIRKEVRRMGRQSCGRHAP